MFSVSHPEILAHLGALQYGLQPVTMPSGDLILIVKITKEAILTAILRQGFKIYLVPDEGEGDALGMISAFFDDEDEPITLRTPLFREDEMLHDLEALLRQARFELYFFDENDRELMGVVIDNTSASRCTELFAEKSFRPLDMAEVPEVLASMTKWFSQRGPDDDRAALPVTFDEKHYSDDFVSVNARTDESDFVAAKSRLLTSLVRKDPGPCQERDIVALLSRVFPTDRILLNPFRADAPTEFADVVVFTGDILLIIQAKDSPNTEQSLGRTLNRKRSAVMGHLVKAVRQMRGALAHLASDAELKLRTQTGTLAIATDGLFPIGLIVLNEMFDDQFREYSVPVLDLSRTSEIPCLVLDYTSLHSVSCSLRSPESFIRALGQINRFGRERGEFPRFRFLGPPSA